MIFLYLMNGMAIAVTKMVEYVVQPVSSEEFILQERVPLICLDKNFGRFFNVIQEQLPSDIMQIGSEVHPELCKLVYPFLESSEYGGSEFAFIGRNDNLLNIICRVSGLQMHRNMVSFSTKHLLRCDVYLSKTGLPPLVHVGEKADDGDLPLAIHELQSKFFPIPHYDRKILFVVGIAITSGSVCFGKLHLDGMFEKLHTFDLRNIFERARCIRAAINVGRWALHALTTDNLLSPVTFPVGHKNKNARRELTVLSEGCIVKNLSAVGFLICIQTSVLKRGARSVSLSGLAPATRMLKRGHCLFIFDLSVFVAFLVPCASCAVRCGVFSSASWTSAAVAGCT